MNPSDRTERSSRREDLISSLSKSLKEELWLSAREPATTKIHVARQLQKLSESIDLKVRQTAFTDSEYKSINFRIIRDWKEVYVLIVNDLDPYSKFILDVKIPEPLARYYDRLYSECAMDYGRNVEVFMVIVHQSLCNVLVLPYPVCMPPSLSCTGFYHREGCILVEDGVYRFRGSLRSLNKYIADVQPIFRIFLAKEKPPLLAS